MLILIVDDEPLALSKLERTVKKIFKNRLDVTVLAVDNYIDALACGRGKPEIAFLDIEMPEMSGVELARRLLKVNPKMNVIFVTAYDDFALEAINMHASGYITKPYMLEDVERELSHLRFPLGMEKAPDEYGESAQEEAPRPKLRVQCFGNFEVFYDGKPLYFQRRGAKEILAYLVALKGAAATRREISTAMWETADEIEKKKDYFRILLSSLRQTLKNYDAEDVLITRRDNFAVDVNRLDCDFYQYLAGDTSPQNQYRGLFMQQYVWSEEFIALLENQIDI